MVKLRYKLGGKVVSVKTARKREDEFISFLKSDVKKRILKVMADCTPNDELSYFIISDDKNEHFKVEGSLNFDYKKFKLAFPLGT